jgi:hypothetical protein
MKNVSGNQAIRNKDVNIFSPIQESFEKFNEAHIDKKADDAMNGNDVTVKCADGIFPLSTENEEKMLPDDFLVSQHILDVTEIKIYTTKNYAMFEPIDGQPLGRVERNVKKLIPSLVKNGGNFMPIIVYKAGNVFKVIDGNTRLEGCKRQNLPVKFEVLDFTNKKAALERMKEINTTSKVWTTLQYIDFYAFGMNDKNYQYLYEYLQNTNLKLTILQEFDSSLKQSAIKSGEFKGADYNRLTLLGTHYNDLDRVIPKSIMGDDVAKARFVKTTIDKVLPKYPNVKFKHIIKKIETNLEKVLNKANIRTIKGYTALLQIVNDCYNTKGTKEVVVFQ